ncbi:MAG: PLP-dependent aminotransferase family protein [Pseudomonadales bacterium]
MQLVIPRSGTRRERVYHALRDAILEGHMRSGHRLAPTRVLALELGFSRNTVEAAFDQLKAEGFITSRVGSGTYVAHSLPEKMLGESSAVRQSASRSRNARVVLSAYGKRAARLPKTEPYAQLPFDFRYGIPDFHVNFRPLWRKLLSRNVFPDDDSTTDGYGPSEGYAPLREALVGYLKRARGVTCTARQIVIVNGSQQALDLIARTLIEPGDRVSIEDPQYLGAREVFRTVGAKLVPIAVDEDGMKTPRDRDSRLAYVTPSHQFPTGVVMSLQRRLELLAWAEAANAFIVEDDYDSEYRYSGPPIQAIHGLRPIERVIYVGTFSKVLFPALRLGYLVLPEPLIGAFRGAKWLSDRHSATLEQRALTDFIEEGHFERLLRQTRIRNAARRDALIGALEKFLSLEVEVHGSPSGLHLLAWVNDRTEQQVAGIMRGAVQKGVGVYPVSPYYLRPAPRPGLLFGFTALRPEEIREGIGRLGEVMRAKPDPHRSRSKS